MSENLCDGGAPHIFTEQGPIGFKSGPVSMAHAYAYVLWIYLETG